MQHMRIPTVVFVICLLAGTVVPAPTGAQAAPAVLLSDVSPTLDGSMLVVSGWVFNRGTGPVSRLVIDASGFAPSGDLVTSGSDGIPWQIPVGGAERFSVLLPIRDRLVRNYAVTVAVTRDPVHPLVRVHGSVSIALYRPLVLSRIRLSAMLKGGKLIFINDVGGMPVEQVTVEATVLLRQPKINLLQILTVTLPPDASEVVAIGGASALLVAVRIVDFVLKTDWESGRFPSFLSGTL
jgi:hypothetical protein